MEVLSSNIPPLGNGRGTYSSHFLDAFFEATEITMVVAYVSADSVIELEALISNHSGLKTFNLVVGMARFDGLYQSQFDALQKLMNTLHGRNLGEIFISTALPIHAKICVFLTDGIPKRALIGSSNLTGLLKDFRQFEVDIATREVREISSAISITNEIISKSCKPLHDSSIQLEILENPNQVLLGIPNVKKVNPLKYSPLRIGPSFDLDVKVEPKSNLNIYFGEGRKQHNRTIPRPWYEVEIIVGVAITRLPGYPQAGTMEAEFDVITDDGWQFPCQIQGQNSKNFRSKDDLRVLGKWLKERLQNAGSLAIGSPVTTETLKHYGRDTIEFTKLSEPNLWYLDFSRPNASN